MDLIFLETCFTLLFEMSALTTLRKWFSCFHKFHDDSCLSHLFSFWRFICVKEGLWCSKYIRILIHFPVDIIARSVKTFTYESLNNVVRLINGVSAILLSILPGKASILEGIHGWELRPTFRGPRLPRWMEK